MSQIKQGVVLASKMQNTAVVKVTRKVKHPVYKKLVSRTKNFKVHDSIGVKPGQIVKIGETRPISKDVHFKILEVVE